MNRMHGLWQWRWHLDEMHVKLNGEMAYLWRAVDQEAEIPESYNTKACDKQAPTTFTRNPIPAIGDELRLD